MPIPEIRYDHMTDRALLDPESTAALHGLSATWAERAWTPLRPSVQQAWVAMARLRAHGPVRPLPDRHMPFLLTRRLRPAYAAWHPIRIAA